MRICPKCESRKIIRASHRRFFVRKYQCRNCEHTFYRTDRRLAENSFKFFKQSPGYLIIAIIIVSVIGFSIAISLETVREGIFKYYRSTTLEPFQQEKLKNKE